MDKSNNGFCRVPRRAMYDNALVKRGAVLRCLCLLCCYVDRDGWTYAGAPGLAGELGIARQNVYPLLKLLRRLGYIERTSRPRGWRVIYDARLPPGRDRRDNPGGAIGWRTSLQKPDFASLPFADSGDGENLQNADNLSPPSQTRTIPQTNRLRDCGTGGAVCRG